MEFGMMVSIISSVVGTVIGGLLKSKSESDIAKYFKLTVKLMPLVPELSALIPVNLNKQQVARNTSLVGLYYVKKREAIAFSMLSLSIGCIALMLINKYYYEINDINAYYTIAFLYFGILLFYFFILTYRVQGAYFGTTDSEVRELLCFVYKNSDCIKDNNGNNGGSKLNIFTDVPETKTKNVPHEHEAGVRI